MTDLLNEPEIEPEIQLEIGPEIQPEIEPEIQLEIEPEIQPELELGIEPEPEVEIMYDTEVAELAEVLAQFNDSQLEMVRNDELNSEMNIEVNEEVDFDFDSCTSILVEGSGNFPYTGDIVCIKFKGYYNENIQFVDIEEISDCYRFEIQSNDYTGWAFSNFNFWNYVLKRIREGTKIKVKVKPEFAFNDCNNYIINDTETLPQNSELIYVIDFIKVEIK